MSHFRVGQKNPQSPLQQSFADIKKPTQKTVSMNSSYYVGSFKWFQHLVSQILQGVPELQHILCDSLNFLFLFQFSVDALNI